MNCNRIFKIVLFLANLQLILGNCKVPSLSLIGIFHNGNERRQLIMPGDTVEFGTTVVLECPQGYGPAASAHSVCLESGQFVPELTYCQEEYQDPNLVNERSKSSFMKNAGSRNDYDSTPYCSSPPVYNGRYMLFGVTVAAGINFTPGSTLVLNCDPGYIVQGNYKIQCLADGSWTQSGICSGDGFENRNGCFAPPIPVVNGYIEPGLSMVGSKRKVQCYEDYMLSGASEIVCTPSKIWTRAGECVRMKSLHVKQTGYGGIPQQPSDPLVVEIRGDSLQAQVETRAPPTASTTVEPASWIEFELFQYKYMLFVGMLIVLTFIGIIVAIVLCCQSC